MSLVLEVAGTATVAICESLLLAWDDRNILPEIEILGVLKDVAAAHAPNPGDDGQDDLHKKVAAWVNEILASGNYVRRR